jgi:hypothetical protein
VIILEAKNVELKMQRLVDINREEEDYHLFNERQSRETVRQLRKSRKVSVLRCLTFLTLSYFSAESRFNQRGVISPQFDSGGYAVDNNNCPSATADSVLCRRT